MSLPPWRAIIFDLDGTLLDTLADLAEAMNRVLERHRWPTHDHAAYRGFIGDGVGMLVRRAMPDDVRQPELIDRCVAEMAADYSTRWADRTHPYDGIPELLTELNARSIPMAILSNKPGEFMARIVGHFFREVPFRCVFGAGGEIPRKPDPGGARQIAARLALPPAEILFLGDSGTDMQTARAAGMIPVGALWGFRSREELREAGARGLLAHPRDLVNLLPRDKKGGRPTVF